MAKRLSKQAADMMGDVHSVLRLERYVTETDLAKAKAKHGDNGAYWVRGYERDLDGCLSLTANQVRHRVKRFIASGRDDDHCLKEEAMHRERCEAEAAKRRNEKLADLCEDLGCTDEPEACAILKVRIGRALKALDERAGKLDDAQRALDLRKLLKGLEALDEN